MFSRPSLIRPFCHSPITASRQTLKFDRTLFLRHSSTAAPIPAPSSVVRKSIPLVALLTISISSYYYFQSTPISTLSQTSFTNLTLSNKLELTKDTTLYTFTVPPNLLPSSKDSTLSTEPISSIYVYQPDLSIQRPYTLLSTEWLKNGGEMELVVKRYPDGEVSRWLTRIPIGGEVGVKGPVSTKLLEQKDEVIFVVGGTGITPAYQYLDSLLSSSSSSTPKTKVKILYTSSTPNDILLKDRMESMKEKLIARGESIEIQYFIGIDENQQKVGSGGGWFGQKPVAREDGLILGRIDKLNLEKFVGRNVLNASALSRLIVVCGPDSLVNAVAGPLARNQRQGPLGGILKELGYTAEMVVKL